MAVQEGRRREIRVPVGFQNKQPQQVFFHAGPMAGPNKDGLPEIHGEQGTVGEEQQILGAHVRIPPAALVELGQPLTQVFQGNRLP